MYLILLTITSIFQYDATIFGGLGGGGEYVVQTGFGWTNGVIMAMLNKWGGKLLCALCQGCKVYFSPNDYEFFFVDATLLK